MKGKHWANSMEQRISRLNPKRQNASFNSNDICCYKLTTNNNVPKRKKTSTQNLLVYDSKLSLHESEES
jgi:hypothetical protein